MIFTSLPPLIELVTVVGALAATFITVTLLFFYCAPSWRKKSPGEGELEGIECEHEHQWTKAGIEQEQKQQQPGTSTQRIAYYGTLSLSAQNSPTRHLRSISAHNPPTHFLSPSHVRTPRRNSSPIAQQQQQQLQHHHQIQIGCGSTLTPNMMDSMSSVAVQPPYWDPDSQQYFHCYAYSYDSANSSRTASPARTATTTTTSFLRKSPCRPSTITSTVPHGNVTTVTITSTSSPSSMSIRQPIPSPLIYSSSPAHSMSQSISSCSHSNISSSGNNSKFQRSSPPQGSSTTNSPGPTMSTSMGYVKKPLMDYSNLFLPQPPAPMKNTLLDSFNLPREDEDSAKKQRTERDDHKKDGSDNDEKDDEILQVSTDETPSQTTRFHVTLGKEVKAKAKARELEMEMKMEKEKEKAGEKAKKMTMPITIPKIRTPDSEPEDYLEVEHVQLEEGNDSPNRTIVDMGMDMDIEKEHGEAIETEMKNISSQSGGQTHHVSDTEADVDKRTILRAIQSESDNSSSGEEKHCAELH